jgi:uncharacterized protein (DUF305 family)
MSTTRIPAATAGGVLALALILTGCGGTTTSAGTAGAPSVAAPSSQSPTGAVSAQHNDADVAFAQAMIPHHQQAIEMAEIATDRAQRPEVKSLAEQIRTAQGPEIAQLNGFLTAWGADVPASDAMSAGVDDSGMTGMNSADHSGMTAMNGPSDSGMAGMMTDAQMNELRTATGAEFDTMFLKMMIEHHRSAVSDAQREVADGSIAEAKQMASTIVTDQTAEIDRMQKLLA